MIKAGEGSSMEAVIICFGCRRRLAPEELAQHSHVEPEKPQDKVAPSPS